MLLCIVGGCLAYLFQGLFNDSIIGTAPIFWVIFGVGVSLLPRKTSKFNQDPRRNNIS